MQNRRTLSAPRLYSIVKDPGGRASCEDAPACTPCVELAWMGFCETEPIPGYAIHGDMLTAGISLVGVTIAGFGVAFGLALVSVAYEEKIFEQSCERLCGQLSSVFDDLGGWGSHFYGSRSPDVYRDSSHL